MISECLDTDWLPFCVKLSLAVHIYVKQDERIMIS